MGRLRCVCYRIECMPVVNFHADFSTCQGLSIRIEQFLVIKKYSLERIYMGSILLRVVFYV